MLLVCTLAVTALSLASIAMIRSTQQQIQWLDAQRASTRGRATADGLYQRALATLRNNPESAGTVLDPAVAIPGARAELIRVSAESTRIQVFLYEGATVPAINTVVEPAKLND